VWICKGDMIAKTEKQPQAGGEPVHA
jgi:hypothetical protein